jgi:hypothetical protein
MRRCAEDGEVVPIGQGGLQQGALLMTLHTCSHPDEFATRFHDLYERAGTIRRRLSTVQRQMRCGADVDLEAVAALRAEADALTDEVAAFLNENNPNN